jgi:membrane protease YdiL (CAAX protease family)
MEPEEHPSTRALVVSALAFYALMALLGLAVIEALDLDPWVLIFGDGDTVPTDTLYGVIAGLGVVGLTWLVRNLKSVKELNKEFRELLGSPSSLAIACLALSSAIGEEILFRGALQESIGLTAATLCFGLMHGGLNPKYRVWALFATASGFLLGWLAILTDNLLAPILCHMTVNYFNLHLVCARMETENDDTCAG